MVGCSLSRRDGSMTVGRDNCKGGDTRRRDPSPPAHDEPGRKGEWQQQPLDEGDVPLQRSFRPSSDDNGSIYSADNANERRRGRLLTPAALRHQSVSPAPPARSWKARCNALWLANKGLLLVLLSQLFGALMNVTTRLLETSGNPLNTFQVPQHHHRTWLVNSEADAAIGYVRSDGHHLALVYLVHVVGSGRAFSARSEGRS